MQLKQYLGQQMPVPPVNKHTKLLCGSLGNSRLTYCLSLQCQQEGKQPIMSIRRIYVCLYRSFFSIPFCLSLRLCCSLCFAFIILYDCQTLEGLKILGCIFCYFTFSPSVSSDLISSVSNC